MKGAWEDCFLQAVSCSAEENELSALKLCVMPWVQALSPKWSVVSCGPGALAEAVPRGGQDWAQTLQWWHSDEGMMYWNPPPQPHPQHVSDVLRRGIRPRPSRLLSGASGENIGSAKVSGALFGIENHRLASRATRGAFSRAQKPMFYVWPREFQQGGW